MKVLKTAGMADYTASSWYKHLLSGYYPTSKSLLPPFKNIMTKGLNLIFGGTRLGNEGWNGVKAEDASDEAALQIFEILKKYHVKHIDTGRLYGNSEAAIGHLKAGTEHGFLIDTKWVGGLFDPTSTTKDRIISDAKDSLAKLGVPKVHAFYLHSLDVKPEIDDTLVAINEGYKLGAFEHFCQDMSSSKV
jgi:aflatoxin B1 aldehyde reductase